MNNDLMRKTIKACLSLKESQVRQRLQAINELLEQRENSLPNNWFWPSYARYAKKGPGKNRKKWQPVKGAVK